MKLLLTPRQQLAFLAEVEKAGGADALVAATHVLSRLKEGRPPDIPRERIAALSNLPRIRHLSETATLSPADVFGALSDVRLQGQPLQLDEAIVASLLMSGAAAFEEAVSVWARLRFGVSSFVESAPIGALAAAMAAGAGGGAFTLIGAFSSTGGCPNEYSLPDQALPAPADKEGSRSPMTAHFEAFLACVSSKAAPSTHVAPHYENHSIDVLTMGSNSLKDGSVYTVKATIEFWAAAADLSDSPTKVTPRVRFHAWSYSPKTRMNGIVTNPNADLDRKQLKEIIDLCANPSSHSS